MLVIILLILSASAIAMPPSELRSLDPKLQTNGGDQWNDENVVADTWQQNVTHGNNMRRGGNNGRRALLDDGNRLVDLECLSERNAALGAELVPKQAANEGS
jgi:hypothetical protein